MLFMIYYLHIRHLGSFPHCTNQYDTEQNSLYHQQAKTLNEKNTGLAGLRE